MGNHGGIQVPDIVLYRESTLDFIIILFVSSINVAELIAHIVVGANWSRYIDEEPSIDNVKLKE